MPALINFPLIFILNSAKKMTFSLRMVKITLLILMRVIYVMFKIPKYMYERFINFE